MDLDIKAVWDAYSSNLIRFIKSKVSNSYDAEDLLQDVFLKLYMNLDKLKDEVKLKSYIYHIVRNAIVDYYRKRKNIYIDDEKFTDLVIDEEENLNFNEEIARCLKRFLVTLPEKYQVPVNLYDIMGKKHGEIAEELNISISGSKTRVQRARQKLRESLLNCCDFEFDTMGNIINYKQKINCEYKDEKHRC